MIILPSLEIVPAKYNTSTNTLLSQIPIDGTGDFTVTRTTSPVAGQSTRVNALGQIELVADNVPRLDYPIGGGCPALLVEPSAQNFVPSGTSFNSATGINYANVSSSPAVGISGTVISKTNTATGSQYANQSCLTALPSGSTNYTISRFFKYNGTDIVTSMEFNNSNQWGGVSWRQPINITSTGVTIGTSISCTGSVENYGDGWYRVIVRLTTGASPSGVSPVTYLMIMPGTVASGGSFLTALPQLETGSVATSYIPTTTGSITRNADVVSVSGAVSGSIGQTQGTIYIECQSEFATNDIIVINTAGQSPGNNYVSITKTPTTNVFRLTVVASGTTILIDQTSAITSFAKIAVAYASGNTAFFINGTQIGSTNTTGFSFNAALNNITFMSNMVSGTKPTRIRAAALYTTRLTDTQLALLTSPYTSYSSMASALSYTLG